MKGLLEKDRRCCFEQWPMFVIGALLLAYAFFAKSPTLVAAESCIVAFVVPLTMLLVDDRNGYSFLMTMPIDAKTYVVEKDLFALITLAVCWLVSRLVLVLSAVCLGTNTFDFGALLSSGYICFLATIILTSLFIALHVRLGSNCLLFAVPLSFMLVTLLFTGMVLLGNGKVFDYYEKLTEVPAVIVAPISIAVTVLLTALFILLGIRAMRKREF